jgi:hypothetical protein
VTTPGLNDDHVTLDRIHHLLEILAFGVVALGVGYEAARALRGALPGLTQRDLLVPCGALVFFAVAAWLWHRRRIRSAGLDLVVVLAASIAAGSLMLTAGHRGLQVVGSDTTLMMIGAPLAVSVSIRCERVLRRRLNGSTGIAAVVALTAALMAVAAVVSKRIVEGLVKDPCVQPPVADPVASWCDDYSVAAALDRKVIAFYVVSTICLWVMIWFARDQNKKTVGINSALAARAVRLVRQRIRRASSGGVGDCYELGMEIRRLRARRLPMATTVRYSGDLSISDSIYLSAEELRVVSDTFEGLVANERDLVSVVVSATEYENAGPTVLVAVSGLKRTSLAVPPDVEVLRSARGDGAELRLTLRPTIERAASNAPPDELPFITDEMVTRTFVLVIIASLLDLVLTPIWLGVSKAEIPWLALVPASIALLSRTIYIIRRGGGIAKWGRRSEVAEIGLLDRLLLVQIWIVGVAILSVGVLTRIGGARSPEALLVSAPPLPYVTSLAAAVMGFALVTLRRPLVGWCSATLCIATYWIVVTSGGMFDPATLRLALSWPMWLLGLTALALVAGGALRDLASETLVRGDVRARSAAAEETPGLIERAGPDGCAPAAAVHRGLRSATEWYMVGSRSASPELEIWHTAASDHCRIQNVESVDLDRLLTLAFWVRLAGGSGYVVRQPDEDGEARYAAALWLAPGPPEARSSPIASEPVQQS